MNLVCREDRYNGEIKEMKKKLFSVLTLAVLVLGIGLVSSASDTMEVRANIIPTEISITVPDTIVFEDITAGYLSEKQNIDVVNTGTTDVSVSASLDDYSGDIFTNLAFKRVLSDELINIRYFDFDILKPATVGSEKSEGIYMYLDLTQYSNATTEIDHTASVIFTAVPL